MVFRGFESCLLTVATRGRRSGEIFLLNANLVVYQSFFLCPEIRDFRKCGHIFALPYLIFMLRYSQEHLIKVHNYFPFAPGFK